MSGEGENVSKNTQFFYQNDFFLLQDWIFDAIYEFFQSPRWQTPVQSFIEENCV